MTRDFFLSYPRSLSPSVSPSLSLSLSLCLSLSLSLFLACIDGGEEAQGLAGGEVAQTHTGVLLLRQSSHSRLEGACVRAWLGVLMSVCCSVLFLRINSLYWFSGRPRLLAHCMWLRVALSKFD